MGFSSSTVNREYISTVNFYLDSVFGKGAKIDSKSALAYSSITSDMYESRKRRTIFKTTIIKIKLSPEESPPLGYLSLKSRILESSPSPKAHVEIFADYDNAWIIITEYMYGLV